MALQFIAASSQYLSMASAAASAYPFSMACWYNPTSNTGTQVFGCVGNSSVNFSYLAYYSVSGMPTGHFTTPSAGTDTVTSGTIMSVGTWNHVAVVFTTSTSITIYVNGVATTTAGTSGTPAVNITLIGATDIGGTVANYANGSIAYHAIWGGYALTQANVTSLYNSGSGASPLLTQNANIVSFLAMQSGAPYLDQITSTNWTVHGTPTVVGDPFGQYVQVGTHAGASGTITYTAINLSPSTPYLFEVTSTDTAGNVSSFSIPVGATTSAGASTNYTVVTTIGPTIEDTTSGLWAISSNYAVTRNGSTLSAVSAPFIELAYVNSVVWGETSVGNWYSFTSSGAIASGPTTTSPLPVISANNTVVTAVGPSIIDSAYNAWTITSGSQVALNGATLAITSGVIEIAYVSGEVWEETSTGWYSFTPSGSIASGPVSPGPSFLLGTPSIVQSNDNANAAAGSVVCAFNSPNAPGNCISAFIYTTGTVVSVTDSRGNSYSLAGSSGSALYAYVAPGIASGANTVTANITGGSTNTLQILEYTGIVTTNPIDSIGTAFGTVAATTASVSLTTVAANTVVLCGVWAAGTDTLAAGAGYVIRSSYVIGHASGAANTNVAVEDRTVFGSALQTATMTWTGSSTWDALVIALKSSVDSDAPLFIQRAINHATGIGSISCPVTTSLTGVGNLLVVYIGTLGTGSIIASITDNKGNAYSQVYFNTAFNASLLCYECLSSIPGVTTMTVVSGAANSGFVQSNFFAQSSSGTVTCAFSLPNTAGNCIVVFLATDSTARTISDSGGNTPKYALATSIGTLYAYVAPNISTGANAVTVTFTGGTFASIEILEYSGIVTAAPVDAVGTGTATGTSFSVPVTTTNASDVLVCGFGSAGTDTISSGPGFTLRSSYNIGHSGGSVNLNWAAQDEVLYSTGAKTATATQTTSGLWYGAVVALKQSTVVINAGNLDVVFYEFSAGTRGAWSFDKDAFAGSNSGIATSISTGSAPVTAQGNEVLIAAAAANGTTVTAGTSGWMPPSGGSVTGLYGWSEYELVTSEAAYSATFTVAATGNAWAAGIGAWYALTGDTRPDSVSQSVSSGVVLPQLLASNSYAVVQTSRNHVSNTGAISCAVTLASTLSGDLLVVFIGTLARGSVITSVTDNKSNAYTLSFSNTSNNASLFCYQCLNCISGATIVTVLSSASVNSLELDVVIYEVSGPGQWAFDKFAVTGTNAGTTAASTGATATTTQANEVVIGACFTNDTTVTAGTTGWTGAAT